MSYFSQKLSPEFVQAMSGTHVIICKTEKLIRSKDEKCLTLNLPNLLNGINPPSIFGTVQLHFRDIRVRIRWWSGNSIEPGQTWLIFVPKILGERACNLECHLNVLIWVAYILQFAQGIHIVFFSQYFGNMTHTHEIWNFSGVLVKIGIKCRTVI